MSDTTDANPAPESSPAKPNQPSFRTAMLCVMLGVLCLAFPFAGAMVNEAMMPPKISFLSYAMAFGLFLTAVGGYASGKWQGWTFGGAAATVVALFLLMTWGADEPPTRVAALDLKITNPDLYDHIQSIEVTDDKNQRLFVAPDRMLNNVRVLIEKDNLSAGCIAFSFVPKAPEESNTHSPEPFNLQVPSSYFKDKLEKRPDQSVFRHRFPVFFDISSKAMFDRPLSQEQAPPPLNAPDLCDEFSQVASLAGPKKPGFWSGFMSAFAVGKSSTDIIRKLNDKDAFVRRAARDQVAAYGPRILPELMGAIPSERSSSYYRYALGAMVSIANMAKQHDVKAMNASLNAKDYQLMSKLMGHSDKTLRKWSTAAMVRLGGKSGVEALLGTLEDSATTANGRYNATFALTEISKKLPAAMRKTVTARQKSITSKTVVKTRSLTLGDESNAEPVEVSGDGWVFLGVKYGQSWGQTNFDWTVKDGQPGEGDVIVAKSEVNLRADPSVFDVKTGWSDSPVLERVAAGQKLTVMRVEEVAEGYFWAAVQ